MCPQDKSHNNEAPAEKKAPKKASLSATVERKVGKKDERQPLDESQDARRHEGNEEHHHEGKPHDTKRRQDQGQCLNDFKHAPKMNPKTK